MRRVTMVRSATLHIGEKETTVDVGKNARDIDLGAVHIAPGEIELGVVIAGEKGAVAPYHVVLERA